MTIAFHCSTCPVLLKVADTSAGKKCKCPKCGTMNAIPAAAAEAEEVEEVEEAPRKVKQSKSAIAPEPASRPRPKIKPIYDDDPADAADDEPDEEERPRKGKGKKGKGKKSKGKKGKLGLLIGGGVALGVLLLLCAGGGIAGALWYFGGGGASSDDNWYYPNNTEMIVSMHVSDLMSSQMYKDAAGAGPMGQLNGLEKQAGIPLDNIDRLVLAGPRGGADMMGIVHTKNTVLAADIEKKLMVSNPGLNFKETTVGKFTLHEPTVSGQGHDAFCVVNGKTVVSGPPATIKSVLERNKKAELSSGMQAILQQTDFHSSVTVVQYGSGNQGGPPGLGNTLFGPAMGGNQPIESSIEEANFGNADMTLRSVTTYKDAKAADAAKKDKDSQVQMLKLLPNGKDIAMSATVSGSVLTVETKVPAALLNKNKH